LKKKTKQKNNNNKVLTTVVPNSPQWLFASNLPEILLITLKLTLKSDWLFCFTVPFSLAQKKM